MLGLIFISETHIFKTIMTQMNGCSIAEKAKTHLLRESNFFTVIFSICQSNNQNTAMEWGCPIILNLKQKGKLIWLIYEVAFW